FRQMKFLTVVASALVAVGFCIPISGGAHKHHTDSDAVRAKILAAYRDNVPIRACGHTLRIFMETLKELPCSSASISSFSVEEDNFHIANACCTDMCVPKDVKDHLCNLY
ncbi:hypothetical protein PENTCL1PPCAC_4299, partial [Pristionchus entomophagus]